MRQERRQERLVQLRPNEKKKTQTPIARFLLETQCVFLFIWPQGQMKRKKRKRRSFASFKKPNAFFLFIWPPGAFSFFSFLFFSPFFFNLFTFFSSVPEGWERTIGKMVIPTQHKKKVCFLFKPTQHQHTHTHTHTHTESTDTETQHHTESTDTHRHKEGRRKEEARKGKEQPKNCC